MAYDMSPTARALIALELMERMLQVAAGALGADFARLEPGTTVELEPLPVRFAGRGQRSGAARASSW